MIARVAVALLLIAVAACDRAPQEVATRSSYWSGEVRGFLASPRTLDDLHFWLRAHNVFYTFDESDLVNGHWVVGLETLPVDTLSCEFWRITLDVTVNDGHKIEGYSLKRIGTCWFDASYVVPVA